jgi:drug/metabolite transporter (DMT)-like permease
MPASALILVLVAGLIHASWNIAAKKARGDIRFSAFTSWVMLLAWAPLGMYLAWQEVPGWDWPQWACVAVSAVVHVGYFVCLLRGYRQADLTVVYPVARGSGPLLSSLAAVLLLGEHLSAWAMAGIAAMISGVFLIAGGPSVWRMATAEAHTTESAALRQRLVHGLGYGLVTGMFIATYTVIDGYGVKVLLISPILLDYVGNVFRLFLVTPALLRDRSAAWAEWRAQWKYAVWVGVISPVSYVLVLYALQIAPLSHVAPAREISMLFAALLGGHLLGERDRWLRLAGAGLIALGVMTLAWN